MTLPGAETMKGGAIGLDCFRFALVLRSLEPLPLMCRPFADLSLAMMGTLMAVGGMGLRWYWIRRWWFAEPLCDVAESDAVQFDAR